MATIPADILTRIQRETAAEIDVVPYQKAHLNVAAQAMEDWYESARTDANDAINAATDAAGNARLSATIKKKMGAAFLKWKAKQELL